MSKHMQKIFRHYGVGQDVGGAAMKQRRINAGLFGARGKMLTPTKAKKAAAESVQSALDRNHAAGNLNRGLTPSGYVPLERVAAARAAHVKRRSERSPQTQALRDAAARVIRARRAEARVMKSFGVKGNPWRSRGGKFGSEATDSDGIPNHTTSTPPAAKAAAKSKQKDLDRVSPGILGSIGSDLLDAIGIH